jgi:hypothetical protein
VNEVLRFLIWILVVSISTLTVYSTLGHPVAFLALMLSLVVALYSLGTKWRVEPSQLSSQKEVEERLEMRKLARELLRRRNHSEEA